MLMKPFKPPRQMNKNVVAADAMSEHEGATRGPTATTTDGEPVPRRTKEAGAAGMCAAGAPTAGMGRDAMRRCSSKDAADDGAKDAARTRWKAGTRQRAKEAAEEEQAAWSPAARGTDAGPPGSLFCRVSELPIHYTGRADGDSDAGKENIDVRASEGAAGTKRKAHKMRSTHRGGPSRATRGGRGAGGGGRGGGNNGGRRRDKRQQLKNQASLLSLFEAGAASGGAQGAEPSGGRLPSEHSTNLKADGGTGGGIRELTREQRQVMEVSVSPGSLVLVRAFAGTGKTTTMIELSRRHPDKAFLYLAFNRSISEEAKRRFPPNTTVSTFNALAYSRIGHRFREQLGRRADVGAAAAELGVAESEAADALENVNAWIKSEPGSELGGELCAGADRREGHDADEMRGCEGGELERRMWQMMCDPDCAAVPMSHQGLLKFFKLRRPDFGKDFDVILVDEAQDCSPVMLQLVLGQLDNGCAVVLIGDEHQRIYGFAGAVDGFELATSRQRGVAAGRRDAHAKSLTESFRFGEEIAGVANNILRVKGGERVGIVGARRDVGLVAGTGDNPMSSPSVVPTSDDDEQVYDRIISVVKDRSRGVPPGSSRRFAALSRRTATLFNLAHELVRQMPESVLKIEFVDDGSSLDVIRDIFFLSEGKYGQIKDKFIKSFARRDAGINALVRHARSSGDAELFSKCQLAHALIRTDTPVLEFLGRISRTDTKIQSTTTKSVSKSLARGQCVLTLATGHKSKGLEFDEVFICDDFIQLRHGVPALEPEVAEEVNLLYVAATRAKQRLFLNQDLSAYQEAIASGAA